MASEISTTPTVDDVEEGRRPFWGARNSRLEGWVGPEWERLIRGVLTNPLSVAGLLIVAMFIFIAVFANQIAPPINENWNTTLIPRDGFRAEPQPPMSPWTRDAPATIPWWYRTFVGDEWVHLMGTTDGQYDIFYGIIWGTRTALSIGIIVVFCSALIGIIVGSIAGFYGGWVDEILMRLVEIFNAFPFLIAVFVLAAILVPRFGQSLWPATIALVAFGWTGYARLLRGDILSTKERDYVRAARSAGARDSRLILSHILPNAIFPTLVVISLDMGSIVLNFAALSFLGVGAPLGYADWGQIVARARAWILTLDQNWYIIVWPGLALLLYGMGWNLLGDALRDILDPKLRGKD